VYAPVPNDPDAVVVAITVERSEAVPYEKPRVVAFAPPVAVIFPLRVAVDVVNDEAA
jgi:hypothetical protein